MKPSDTIFAYSWDAIQRAQCGGRLADPVNKKQGDYGADPLGDGTFRMVPSGAIVDLIERNRRLGSR